MTKQDVKYLLDALTGRYQYWRGNEGQLDAWADELVNVPVEAGRLAISKLADNGYEKTPPTAMQFKRLCFMNTHRSQTSENNCIAHGCRLAKEFDEKCAYHFAAPVEHADLVNSRIDYYRVDLDYLRWLEQACVVEIAQPELYDTPKKIIEARWDCPIHENESPLLYRARVAVMVRNKILDGIVTVPVTTELSDPVEPVEVTSMDQVTGALL